MAACTSPTLASVLADCAKLSTEDRRALLKELNIEASIRPWEDGTSIPEDTAPAPSQSSRPVPITIEGSCSARDTVVGCPWCRRPVTLVAHEKSCSSAPVDLAPVDGSIPARFAYVALIYGPACHKYFLGALVLGWGLLQYAGKTGERVLMYTHDVPSQYIEALGAVGWTCRKVHYLSSVARALFHNARTSRFVDVFTKLRALEMEEFEKVLCLDIDMLVRAPPDMSEIEPLDSLFMLEAPAAMKRGDPCPAHGARVAYCDLWAHPGRRAGDKIPVHQQASGINAGVMLFKPDAATMHEMEAEVRDWYHPEHYATYMPEQEYLTRFYGTFSQWTHVGCAYNFEVDKNERIPHDFTEAHKPIRAAGTPLANSHPGAVVLHYSGHGVKPWNLLFETSPATESESSGASSWKRKWEAPQEQLVVATAGGLAQFQERLIAEGPAHRLEGYNDTPRLWAAILEWLEQLQEAATLAAEKGHDPIAIMAATLAVQTNSQEDNEYWPKSAQANENNK